MIRKRIPKKGSRSRRYNSVNSKREKMFCRQIPFGKALQKDKEPLEPTQNDWNFLSRRNLCNKFRWRVKINYHDAKEKLWARTKFLLWQILFQYPYGLISKLLAIRWKLCQFRLFINDGAKHIYIGDEPSFSTCVDNNVMEWSNCWFTATRDRAFHMIK